jgi:hypothetical protein
MSAINGDKARFHKDRKEKIARRARNRERLATLAAAAKSASPALASGKKAVSA